MTMHQRKIKASIREFLGEPDLQDSLDIFKNKILDSLGLMDLILYIELEFGITVFAEEISQENFQTLDSISDFIIRKSKTPRPE